MKPLPSVEEMLAEYDFDWATGEFRFPVRVKGWGSLRGKRAGNGWQTARDRGSSTGYVKLRVKRQYYMYHRCVWKMFSGRDPIGVIDHIDGDRQNNRIENLRDVTNAENAENNHGKGFWANTHRIRQKTLEDIRRQEAARRQQNLESRERATLARLLAKYGSG